MSDDPIIQADHLEKTFYRAEKGRGLRGALKGLFFPKRTRVQAVDDVSFSIRAGEIVGYLGPNGAGKSTTIKILTGILHPTAGSVLVNGLSPHKRRREVVQNIGVVFGQRSQLNWDLALGESFELFKRIYRIPQATFDRNLAWMNEVLRIDDLVKTPVRQLSLGQRMRGELAAAVLHSPAILFLDEPTIGLDIEAKHAVRDFIHETNRIFNTTVILTTHDLQDVERLCQRLLVINDGHLVEDGPLTSLVARLAPYRTLVIDFESDPGMIEHPHAKVVKREGLRVWIDFPRDTVSAAELIATLSLHHPIRDLSIKEADIEQVVKLVYGEGKLSRPVSEKTFD